MGYHVIDPSEIDPEPDRPAAEARVMNEAAGLTPKDDKLGFRVYDAEPGQDLSKFYHYHDEQVEVFYVLEGEMHVRTPEGEHTVPAGQVFVAEPGSPHLSYNPEDATSNVRAFVVGAPSVDDGHIYEPEE